MHDRHGMQGLMSWSLLGSTGFLSRSLASWLVGNFFVLSGYEQLHQPGSRGLPKRGSKAGGRPPEREKEACVNR